MNSSVSTEYIAEAYGEELVEIAKEQMQCIFSGKQETDLPEWFQKREPVR